MKFLNGDLRIKINPEIMAEIVRNNSNLLSTGEIIYTKIRKADYEADIVIREADNSILVTKIGSECISPQEILELYNKLTVDFGSGVELLLIFTGKYDQTIVHPRIKILTLNCYLHAPVTDVYGRNALMSQIE